MGSVKVSYTTAHLTDIAKGFEFRATSIRLLRDMSKPNSRAYRTMTAEANVWEHAAAILRHTILTPLEGSK